MQGQQWLSEFVGEGAIAGGCW